MNLLTNEIREILFCHRGTLKSVSLTPQWLQQSGSIQEERLGTTEEDKMYLCFPLENLCCLALEE